MSHLCSFFEVEAAEGILIAVTEDREEQEEDRGQIPLVALAMTWRGKNILPDSVERKKESRQFDHHLANLIPRTHRWPRVLVLGGGTQYIRVSKSSYVTK